jgi:hypothetical protein
MKRREGKIRVQAREPKVDQSAYNTIQGGIGVWQSETITEAY